MSQRPFIVSALVAGLVIAAIVGRGLASESTIPVPRQGRWLEALALLPQDSKQDLPEVSIVDYAQWRRAKARFDKTALLSDYQTSRDGVDTLDRAHDVGLMVSSGYPVSYRIFSGDFQLDSARRSLETVVETSTVLGGLRNMPRTVTEESYRGLPFVKVGPVANLPRWEQAQNGRRFVYRIVPLGDDTDPSRYLKDMLDVAAGRRPSTADEDRFRLLTPGAESLGLIEASLIGEPYTLSAFERLLRREYGNEAVDRLAGQTLLMPYRSFAAGWGVDAGGTYMGLVILNNTEADATTNAVRLQRRFDEGVSFKTRSPWLDSIDSTEIRSEGKLTIARFRTGPTLWRLIIDNLDNLWMSR